MAWPIRQHMQIIRGDSYKKSESRALEWWSSSWPNLAGAELSLKIGFSNTNIFGAHAITWKQTLPGGAETRVAFVELTEKQTEEVTENEYDYILVAKLTSGSVVTIAFGHLTVGAEPGQAPLMPST